MLKIENLVKAYGKFTAVNDLSLYIPQGGIYGFVGPNGAGKTTTMKIAAGLLKQTSGKVVIDGVDVTQKPSLIREKVGYMPDFFGVYDDFKVTEYMEFYAAAYDIPKIKSAGTINELLELVDLEDKRDAYVDTLSRGMKQRLCLARSLVHDPAMLILDEPASGLDPRARIEMKEVLKKLSSMGKTILISSHILPELAEICTYIGIIEHGRMVVSGSVDDISNKLSNKLAGSRGIRLKVIEGIERAAAILQQSTGVDSVTVKESEIEFTFNGNDDTLAGLLRSLVGGGIPVISFTELLSNLEDVFMKVTMGGEPK